LLRRGNRRRNGKQRNPRNLILDFFFSEIGSGATPHPRPRGGHGQLRRDAHSDKAYGAAVAAVMGKVKILNLIVDQPPNTSVDFSSANSMQDIGRKLLQSIGFAAPDDVSIAAAIEANDVFIARLESIRDAAQGLTIDQDD
jgi:hypothetical protein